MKTGTKRQVADKCEELVELIVKDMGIHNGTGNTRYYSEMKADLVTKFPDINVNTLLRNKVRKLIKPDIDDSKLSEDSEEQKTLKVPKGQTPRRTHPHENFLVSMNFERHFHDCNELLFIRTLCYFKGLFTKLVARRAKKLRKKDATQRLVTEVTASWNRCEKFKIVIPGRYNKLRRFPYVFSFMKRFHF